MGSVSERTKCIQTVWRILIHKNLTTGPCVLICSKQMLAVMDTLTICGCVFFFQSLNKLGTHAILSSHCSFVKQMEQCLAQVEHLVMVKVHTTYQKHLQ